jgi:hypothetical protein
VPFIGMACVVLVARCRSIKSDKHCDDDGPGAAQPAMPTLSS